MVWKLVFWITLVDLVVGYVAAILAGGDNPETGYPFDNVEGWIESFVYLTILLGLYAYAYGKKLFPQFIWKIILLSFIVYALYGFVQTIIDAYNRISIEPTFLVVIITFTTIAVAIAIGLLILYVLYRLAYKK